MRKHCRKVAEALLLKWVFQTCGSTAIKSVTVSLHYLPRYLCPTVTCRAPIQRFQINPCCTPKKHIRTIKTQKACVTNKNMQVCLFEYKRESNTDLISCGMLVMMVRISVLNQTKRCCQLHHGKVIRCNYCKAPIAKLQSSSMVQVAFA